MALTAALARWDFTPIAADDVREFARSDVVVRTALVVGVEVEVVERIVGVVAG